MSQNPSGTYNIDRRTVLRASGGAGLTAGLMSLAGCVDDTAVDEVTITLSEFPDVEDPLDHITGDYFDVYDHVYEPLLDFEPGEGLFPRVIEDWEIVGGGTTEVQLRDDVVFHNGDEMTAEDVAFTINRTVNDEIGVASDIGAFGLGSIEGAEAVGDHTLNINYSAAPGLAEFEFGNYSRAMNREWTIDNFGADEPGESVSGDSPDAFNGTGPYEVVEYEPGVEIVLERFDDYWGEAPPFETVTFNAADESSTRVASLETGETDLTINILPEDVATVNEADGVEIRQVTSFRTVFLPMKNTVEPFDSLEFRQAMNHAVDNEGIVEDVLSGFGEARGQPVSPGINGYNPDVEPYEHDPELAEDLVREAGFTEDDPADIELTVPSGRYLNDEQVGLTAGDQIDDLSNVNCEVNVVEFPVVSDENSAGVDPEDIEHPFYMIGWGVITGDTDYGVNGFFNQEVPTRSFDDEELSNAIQDSQQIEDPDQRRQRLEEVNELAHEKAPWVFLHTQESIYGVNEDIQWQPREDESIFVFEME